MGKSNVNKMQTAAAKSTQSHLASTQAAAGLAATNAPTSRPPLPLAPFDLDVPAYHTPDVDDRPVNWPVYPQRDTVHATVLNLDTKSRQERFATPQGTFMFRKTRGERCPMPIISISTYVCSCFAVVVNGTTSAGFTPVGYITEDLGETTLHSWLRLARGAAGAKDAGLQLVCVVRDVLRGLRAVHESGFVYGDSLKSSKIMITHSGAAKLLLPSSGISSAAVPVHDDMRALGRLLLQWVGVVPNAADSLGPLIRALTGDGEPPSAADALKLVPADDVAAFSRQAGALLARSTTCLDEFDHVKVATADNADVQLSLTCIGLATAMSRLMSAQRARSLACARELADLVTRFHSHDTRLPVKESVLYKLYLAAVDVLLDLNTTADNASASVLLASTPCEDVMGGAIPKEAFVARTARVQRQQGRVAEARTLLETHLTADGTQEYKSSAGYALLINEQLKLLTLYGTSSEVETAVTSIDVSGIHIYCFPAVTCTLARARLRLGRFLDGLIAARLFNDVQLHLAQHVGMVHPWYAINSVDQAEAFRLQGGEVPRRAQEGLKQALLFLNGKLDSDHPAIRHALRSSLDTALGGDLTAPATRKAVLQCAEALLAAQRTALGKQHPQYFAAMKTKAEALLAFTTPQTSDVNGVVKLCDQILEGLESAGGVETRAIASAKCLKAQALLLRKSSENAQQCLDLYDEVLQMTFHTPRSPYVDAYCGKAVVKQTIGNPSDCIEALAYLDAAEELLLKADSPNEVAKILWQKEPLLKALGRNHALLELYDRIFALEASTAPANDPDLTLKRLLTLKGNQANVLQEVGGPENLLKADELYTQIYEEKCMLLGPEHESTISTLANRASARQRLDDEKQVQKAVDDYDIVIKAHSKVLGPTHSRVLTTMCNKAIALTRLTDADSLTSSIDLFEKVLAERTRTLKRSHPLVLSTLVNFTIALRKAGNERCLLRADTLYDIMLSRQDLEDAERISTMRYQALGLVALGHRGELPKAIRLCDAALAKVAPNHPVAVELQQAKAAAKAILAAREGAA